MKTVRFTQVVERAGKPTVHVSWLPPEKDPALKRALADHRVMTVHQQLRGGKKDHGVVGLERGGPVQVLVFPKSLRRFRDRKVVGIDYRLLPAPSDAPELSSAAHLEPVKGAKRAGKASVIALPSPPAAKKPAAEPKPRPAAKPKPAPATRTASRKKPGRRVAAPPEPAPPSRDDLLVVIRRAAADLKAGRAVPAYERLRTVLESEPR